MTHPLFQMNCKIDRIELTQIVGYNEAMKHSLVKGKELMVLLDGYLANASVWNTTVFTLSAKEARKKLDVASSITNLNAFPQNGESAIERVGLQRMQSQHSQSHQVQMEVTCTQKEFTRKLRELLKRDFPHHPNEHFSYYLNQNPNLLMDLRPDLSRLIPNGSNFKTAFEKARRSLVQDKHLDKKKRQAAIYRDREL